MESSKEKVVYTPCQGWGCHEHCIIEAHSINGKLVRTQRAVLGGPQPDNAICQKGIMTAKLPYQDDKLLYPLKRVGERGEGKFERISWDQAIQEIGDKLNEIREKYGPRSIVNQIFICGYPLTYLNMCYPLLMRWINVTDQTNIEGPTTDKGNWMTVLMDYNNPSTYNDERMMKDKDLIINWGGNPIGFTRAATTSQVLMDVQENGGRIINVGVMFDTTAAKADLNVLIKPATDAAAILAIVKIILDENAIDEAFLIEKTVAPFLVRKDNGKYLRASDVFEGGSKEEYVMFDKMTRSYVAVPRRGSGSGALRLVGRPSDADALDVSDWGEKIEGSAFAADLFNVSTVNGIECQTALMMLKDHVQRYTPESQEEITGVSPDIIRQIAREYIDTPNSSVYLYYGIRYTNNIGACRALNLLPVLTGRAEKPGGIIIVGLQDTAPAALNDAEIYFPPQPVKGGYITYDELLESFKDPTKQQYKAFLNWMGNPVLNFPNRQLWRDTIFPNMELIVAMEIRMCDTVMFADYVLPEASNYERYEVFPHNNRLILTEPAIEPRGECLPPHEILKRLSAKIGVGEYFDKTIDEWLEIKLRTTDPAIAGVEPPITLERLKKEKIIELNLPQGENDFFNAMENMIYGTPSGRLEFYKEELASVGGAMGDFYPARIHNEEERKDYPFHFFNGRHRLFMQGQFTHTPELRYLAREKYGASLNPVTAERLGLKDGDKVEVYSKFGSCIVPLHLTNWIPPEMVHTWYAYDANDYPESDPPTAVACCGSNDDARSEIPSVWDPIVRRRHIESGAPEYLLSYPGEGKGEVHWDNLCNIRKVEEA